LTLLDRIWIGIRCEELQRKPVEDSALTVARHDPDALELWEAQKDVPLDQRRELLRLADMPSNKMLGPLADLAEDLRDLRLRLDGGDGYRAAGRLIRRHRGPQLRRDAVIAKVAQLETRDRGRPISPRMVRSCWVEYRRLVLAARLIRDDEAT
jgi:hypothetical protein